MGTKETGSSIPTGVNEPQVENVEIVECLEVDSPEGEPEPLTPQKETYTPQCFLRSWSRISPKPSK